MNASDREARLTALLHEPDGPVARARAFGIDVSLTLRNMMLTPEERWERANAQLAAARDRRGQRPHEIGRL